MTIMALTWPCHRVNTCHIVSYLLSSKVPGAGKPQPCHLPLVPRVSYPLLVLLVEEAGQTTWDHGIQKCWGGWWQDGPCLSVLCYCPSPLYMACPLQPGGWVRRHSIDLVDAGEGCRSDTLGRGRMGLLRLGEEGLGLRCAEVWEGALNLELEGM